MAISDAWSVHPRQFPDDRGRFLEWFRNDRLADVAGHRFDLAQANCSASRRGVVRGVHYADVPVGQAKYVTCVSGAVLDFVVDLRVGSPTFGKVDRVHLDDVECAAVYLAEGLGHAFVTLSETATVVYLCNQVYDPSAEHGVHPLDPEIGLDMGGLQPVLSPKDAEAPSLAEALALGALPDYAVCRAFYSTREGS
jgi:dTDP-4-dehydrorhamnose 3,5-epimerase